MGRQSTQARSRPTDLHRRNGHLNQNGATAWPASTRRTAGRQNPARSLENHHLCRGPALHSSYCTMRHQWPDERQCLPRLCRTSPGADPAGRVLAYVAPPIAPKASQGSATRPDKEQPPPNDVGVSGSQGLSTTLVLRLLTPIDISELSSKQR